VGIAWQHPLLARVVFGLVAGMIAVVFEITYATAIFSGSLGEFALYEGCHPTGCFGGDLSIMLARGIGLALWGGLAVSLVMALTSSMRSLVAIPQGAPAVILGFAATRIAGQLPPSASAMEVLSTVVVTIVLTSVLAGAFFLGLGSFRLGRLVRYVPYPVVGGFLAGTGLLFVEGAFGIMTGEPLNLATLPAFAAPDMLARWVPGMGFGALLLFVSRRWRHPLALPAALLAGSGLFYLGADWIAMAGAASDPADLLLGPFTEPVRWQPAHVIAAFGYADWGAVFGQAGQIGSILLVSVIALLVSATAIELAAGRDLDLDRELRAAGLANLAGGLGGGHVGYHDPSLSAFGQGRTANSRLPGVMVALVCAGVLAGGAGVIPWLPRPALGGILAFLGLTYVTRWLFEGWSSHAKIDYLFILLIALVTGFFGILEGVGVGVLLAALLFTTGYSRIDIVRQALTGAEVHSNVERSPDERRVLRARGERIHVLKLQGYLFFGTAHRLYERIKTWTSSGGHGGARYLILDFKRVNGLDVSAEHSFVKVMRLLSARQDRLLLTHVPPPVRARLARAVRAHGFEHGFRVLADLDRGLERCEADLLAEADSVQGPRALRDQLADAFGGSEPADRFLSKLEQVSLDAGEVLVRRGAPSDTMYLLVTGELHARVELDDQQSVRLRSMRPGALVGELGMLLGTPRSTSVVAARPSRLYVIPQHALDALTREDPELLQAFHRFVMRTLAERLVDNARTIRALSD